LFVSLSRGAIGISILQLILMFALFGKRKFGLHKKALLLMGLLFTAIFVVKLYLSFFSVIHNEECKVMMFDKNMCKSIAFEARPDYWKTALDTFMKNPVFGTGPGTYGQAATLYKGKQAFWSKYAHSSFLQIFSETGILGGSAFLILMLGSLVSIWNSFKREKDGTIQKSLFIGLVGIVLNSFIDYDWQFAGTWILTIAFMAIALRTTGTSSLLGKKYSIPQFATMYGRFLLGFSQVAIVILGAMYIVTDYLIVRDVNLAAKISPYFHWHKTVYALAPLADAQREKIDFIYKSDPNYLLYMYSKEPDVSKKMEYGKKLAEADKWKVFELNNTDYYLANNLIDDATAEVIHRYFLWEKNAAEFSFDEKVALSQDLLSVAEANFKKQQYELAGRLYSYADNTDSWLLSERIPPFSGSVDANEVSFFREISQVPPANLGKYYMDYVGRYAEVLKLVAVASDDRFVSAHVSEYLAFVPWKKSEVWLSFAPLYIDRIERTLSEKNLSESVSISTELYHLWKALSGETVVLDSHLEEQSARLLTEVANKGVIAGSKDSIDLYTYAREMYPLILSEETVPTWTEQTILSTIHEDLLQKYIDSFEFEDLKHMNYKNSGYQRVFNQLLISLARRADDQALNIYARRYQELPRHNSDLVALLTKDLLATSDAHAEKGQWKDAQAVVAVLKLLHPDDYYIIALPGHLAVAEQNLPKAKQMYAECLAVYEYHGECYRAMKLIQENKTVPQRYFMISEVAQGLRNDNSLPALK
jgi:hypothetical protein